MPSTHLRRLERKNQRDDEGRISKALQGLIFVFVFLLHQWRIFLNLRSTHPYSHTCPITHFLRKIDQQDRQDDDDDMRQHRIQSPPLGRIDSRASRGVNIHSTHIQHALT